LVLIRPVYSIACQILAGRQKTFWYADQANRADNKAGFNPHDSRNPHTLIFFLIAARVVSS
jgi:hypothetical protein